jgi:hypothetical protein
MSAPSTPCRLCVDDADMAMFCRHTEAEVALAEAIARAVQGDACTPEHAAFFLHAEDPANVIACLGEHSSWTVTTNPAGYDMTLVVNGVVFAVDPNEEGAGIARPQPPAFICQRCGKSWAEAAETGCHVLNWSREGVEVECDECSEVQTVPRWWPMTPLSGGSR